MILRYILREGLGVSWTYQSDTTISRYSLESPNDVANAMFLVKVHKYKNEVPYSQYPFFQYDDEITPKVLKSQRKILRRAPLEIRLYYRQRTWDVSSSKASSHDLQKKSETRHLVTNNPTNNPNQSWKDKSGIIYSCLLNTT